MLRVLLLHFCLLLAGMAGAIQEVKTIIHTDHLGSPIVGRSMEGETVFERHHEPYGAQLEAPEDRVASGYTGHQEMRDYGLVYAGARWYDPVIGRFLSPDPVKYSVGSPVSFNRYAYANNNPFRFFDPFGLSPQDAAWAAVGEENPSKALSGAASNVADGMAQFGDAIEPDAYSIIPAGLLLKGKNLFRLIVKNRVATNVPTQGRKFNQLSRRGWSQNTIDKLVNNPYTTRSSINKATGNNATAYFRKDGHYVVRDDVTGDVVQMSDTKVSVGTGPGQWAPDATIKDPYVP